jgi:hypothetical protein
MWQADTFHWEPSILDGTSYARIEGDGRTPGEPFSYGLKLPAGFDGHYCFNARTELMVLRGEIRYGSRWLRQGERGRLAAGIIYSVRPETPSVLLISTIAPWPTHSEPGAPRVAVERC